jgi:ketopantoate reductase
VRLGDLSGASPKRINATAAPLQDADFTVQASNAVRLEMWENG